MNNSIKPQNFIRYFWTLSLLIGLIFSFQMSAYANDVTERDLGGIQTERQDNQTQSDGNLAEAAEGNFKTGFKSIGRGFKNGAKATGRGFKKAGNTMGRGFKKAGTTMGRGFKKAGSAIKTFFVGKKDPKEIKEPKTEQREIIAEKTTQEWAPSELDRETQASQPSQDDTLELDSNTESELGADDWA